MTLQNRITPTGEIVSDPARGLLMGNRGCLHRPDRTLGVTRWRSRLWICCRLVWKDVRRDPMPPGRWTALFFLDEVTAFAAGHRPCAYCRRADYLAFAEAWRSARGMTTRPKAIQMDAQLHAERVDPRTRRQLTHRSSWDRLPDGVMVRHRDQPAVVLGGRVLPWSFGGYGRSGHGKTGYGGSGHGKTGHGGSGHGRSGEGGETPLAGDTVEVLTPPATVAVIAAGYRPWIHPSAPASDALRVLTGHDEGGVN